MIVFKHEAILSFVDRLIRDREFSEWFVAQPAQALASHHLTIADLRDVVEVVESDRYQPDAARALRPTMRLLIDLSGDAPVPGGADAELDTRVLDDRCARLSRELADARERMARLRASKPRPWWRFW